MLVQRLHELYQESDTPARLPHFHLLVYFDEAHRLRTSSQNDDAYTNFMRAIKIVEEISIFFVFLSTNSSIQFFAPSAAEYPSDRIRNEADLEQPFFELPFETFSHQFSAQVQEASKMTLVGACELEQMSKFGRPMSG
jgi:hypothetical protein